MNMLKYSEVFIKNEPQTRSSWNASSAMAEGSQRSARKQPVMNAEPSIALNVK